LFSRFEPKIIFLLLTLLLKITTVKSQDCGEFVNKKYDEVVFLCTHNSYSSAENHFLFPNQKYNIKRQLEDGVRSFMLDVYNSKDKVVLYHIYPIFGQSKLKDILLDFKLFLESNPNQIITIFFEDYTSQKLLEKEFMGTQLSNYIYKKESQNWGTIQEMIDSNKRLIVFTDKTDNTSDLFHFTWDFIAETSFDVKNKNEFNSNFNRGDSTNNLFLLNHFLSPIQSILKSSVINTFSFLTNRINNCKRKPNFIAVDFYNKGGSIDVVKMLNKQ